MGNCSPKGIAGECNAIHLVTDSGHIIELKGPRLVRDVLLEYPAHAIFRQGRDSSPLPNHEYLIGGQSYIILPVEQNILHFASCSTDGTSQDHGPGPAGGDPPGMSGVASSDFVPEKEGCGWDHQAPALQVLPSLGDGIWRVKMVIKREQLGEILAGEVNTEALIENMRMAAAASSGGFRPRKSRSSWGDCVVRR